jgi:DNA-binding NarL/FixJ family response regulator
MTTPPYRILIVDDNKIVRQALRYLRDQVEEFVVVGDTNGDSGLALSIELKPQVILIDPRLSSFDAGMCLLAEIHEMIEDAGIIALVESGEEPDLVYQAVYSGAKGCLLKTNSGIDELKEAIHKVAQGQAFLSASALTRLVKSLSNPPELPQRAALEQPDALTVRECDVMKLVAQGYSNREIANQLVISESTVRSHLQHIFEKLQLTNRVQVAAFALKSGRVDLTGGKAALANHTVREASFR